MQYLELTEEEERAAAAATAAAAEEQRRESRAARAASGLSAAAPDNAAPAARSGSGGSSGARAPVRKLKLGFRWGYSLRSLRKALSVLRESWHMEPSKAPAIAGALAFVWWQGNAHAPLNCLGHAGRRTAWRRRTTIITAAASAPCLTEG